LLYLPLSYRNWRIVRKYKAPDITAKLRKIHDKLSGQAYQRLTCLFCSPFSLLILLYLLSLHWNETILFPNGRRFKLSYVQNRYFSAELFEVFKIIFPVLQKEVIGELPNCSFFRIGYVLVKIFLTYLGQNVEKAGYRMVVILSTSERDNPNFCPNFQFLSKVQFFDIG